jgi:hypothetical protein
MERLPPSNAGDDEMRDTIDMAREAGFADWLDARLISPPPFERLVELVRADEREQGQRWFDAVTAQHKQEILAEREACAKVAEDSDHVVSGRGYYDQLGNADATVRNIAAAIRARGAKHD